MHPILTAHLRYPRKDAIINIVKVHTVDGPNVVATVLEIENVVNGCSLRRPIDSLEIRWHRSVVAAVRDRISDHKADDPVGIGIPINKRYA